MDQRCRVMLLTNTTHSILNIEQGCIHIFIAEIDRPSYHQFDLGWSSDGARCDIHGLDLSRTFSK